MLQSSCGDDRKNELGPLESHVLASLEARALTLKNTPPLFVGCGTHIRFFL